MFILPIITNFLFVIHAKRGRQNHRIMSTCFHANEKKETSPRDEKRASSTNVM